MDHVDMDLREKESQIATATEAGERIAKRMKTDSLLPETEREQGS